MTKAKKADGDVDGNVEGYGDGGADEEAASIGGAGLLGGKRAETSTSSARVGAAGGRPAGKKGWLFSKPPLHSACTHERVRIPKILARNPRTPYTLNPKP